MQYSVKLVHSYDTMADKPIKMEFKNCVVMTHHDAKWKIELGWMVFKIVLGNALRKPSGPLSGHTNLWHHPRNSFVMNCTSWVLQSMFCIFLAHILRMHFNVLVDCTYVKEIIHSYVVSFCQVEQFFGAGHTDTEL